MTEPIEIIEYKGIKINIYQDEYYQPDEMDNNELFLTSYHQDFTIESKIVSKAECIALATSDYDEDMAYRIKELKKTYHYFGLEAYIHSGVVLAISYEGNFPDRRWDVSQVGLIFVAKTLTKSRAKAKKIAQSLIDEVNDIQSGNVYGYQTEPETESCYGYIGNYDKSGLLDDAKANIDFYIAKRKAEQAKKVKAEIKNKVPLDKRIAFCL
jgi:hypothetical protein